MARVCTTSYVLDSLRVLLGAPYGATGARENRVTRRVIAALAGDALAAATLAACGGDDDDGAADATTAATTTGEMESMADLSGVKDYLLDHTGQLTGFTAQFKTDAQAYHDMAEASGFDYEQLWADNAAELTPLLEGMKNDWVEGNPYYERMEGVVAGTPSLAEYDVI